MAESHLQNSHPMLQATYPKKTTTTRTRRKTTLASGPPVSTASKWISGKAQLDLLDLILDWIASILYHCCQWANPLIKRCFIKTPILLCKLQYELLKFSNTSPVVISALSLGPRKTSQNQTSVHTDRTPNASFHDLWANSDKHMTDTVRVQSIGHFW